MAVAEVDRNGKTAKVKRSFIHGMISVCCLVWKSRCSSLVPRWGNVFALLFSDHDGLSLLTQFPYPDYGQTAVAACHDIRIPRTSTLHTILGVKSDISRTSREADEVGEVVIHPAQYLRRLRSARLTIRQKAIWFLR